MRRAEVAQEERFRATWLDPLHRARLPTAAANPRGSV